MLPRHEDFGDQRSCQQFCLQVIRVAPHLPDSMSLRDRGVLARAALPMFLPMLLGVVIPTAIPDLALWLPEVLTRN